MIFNGYTKEDKVKFYQKQLKIGSTIHTKFAFKPVTLVNNKVIWLQRYKMLYKWNDHWEELIEYPFLNDMISQNVIDLAIKSNIEKLTAFIQRL